MGGDVVDLRDVDRTHVALVGGKGAPLGELARLGGIEVPAGICVTTEAYRRVVEASPAIRAQVAELAGLDVRDTEAVRERSEAIRCAVEELTLPDDLADAVTGALAAIGGDHWAVRSSATAEDLPGASAAGQHDSHLDVPTAAVLEHVRRCWASLFTERAVTYRLRGGTEQADVRMAVVVQQMVAARAAGVLFTADPVTGDRRVSVVEAVPGLGDGLVSGRVTPDTIRVRGGEVVSEGLASERAVLGRGDLEALVRLGTRVAGHLGSPQDIEWCLDDEGLHVVQSRPITTLFPIPAADDDGYHVYVSVGHQQMMTDAMRPLGISMWQLTAGPPMHEAGSRLFVDVTERLASPATRDALVELMGRSDPLLGDALDEVLARGDLPPAAEGAPPPPAPLSTDATQLIEADPDLVTRLVAENEASVADLERRIADRTGTALLDLVREDVLELKRLLFDPRSMSVILAGMNASHWLNDHLEEWLGVPNASDALTRSAPGNVTSEMGLALLDVADAVRPHPEVVAFLRGADDDAFLDHLPALEGGVEAAEAIRTYLDRYGVRCIGEIDITRPRWHERPSVLLPTILGHVDALEPGERARRDAQGRDEAARAEHDLLARVRALPDGEARAAEVKRMIDRVRTFIGYREYPKYGIVRRYAIYKQALLSEADRLVQVGVLDDAEDVFFLTFPELHDVVESHEVDHDLVRRRRARLRAHEALTPPRVLTSHGECLSGSYHRGDVPDGALVGLAVSSGVVEGRARVVSDVGTAELGHGDVLVTTFTDPSWSPLFVAVAGLVTEVGGLMTHGAVIAREYGLPAVVGVVGATTTIQDGQRIRVDGTRGWVEVLDG